jgi:hypothetical protein
VKKGSAHPILPPFLPTAVSKRPSVVTISPPDWFHSRMRIIFKSFLNGGS